MGIGPFLNSPKIYAFSLDTVGILVFNFFQKPGKLTFSNVTESGAPTATIEFKFLDR